MKQKIKLTALILSAALLLSGCQLFGGKKDTSSASETETTAASAATADRSATETATEKPVETTTQKPEPKGDISPMMWKVTGEKGNTLYLFGTIHMGDTRNDTVLTQLTGTLEGCDALAVEFDVNALEQDTQLQTQMAMKMMYTDGTTVKDHLRSDLYEQSVTYLTENDNYNMMYDYFRTAYWTILLEQTAIENTKYSLDNAVDSKLLQYAGDHSMEILEVESAAFQYDIEANFPDALCELQIESFLEDKDSYESDITELYEAWLGGDEEALTELEYGVDEEEYAKLTEEQKALYEDYQKTMLTDRNVGMAEKAEQYLQSGKTVFFAVGAGHMVSDEGVVQLLKNKGFTVERVQ